MSYDQCTSKQVSELLEKDRDARVKFRVLLHFSTDNVPGDHLKRSFRATDDFCSTVLERSFSWETDFVHVSPECVCTEPKKAYLLFDFNVGTRGLDLDEIPLYYYGVRYDERGAPFYYQRQNVKARDYCRAFRWGGNERYAQSIEETLAAQKRAANEGLATDEGTAE